MSEQAVKEAIGAVFFSLLSLYDDDAAHESMKLLSAALETKSVRDPAARKILKSLIQSYQPASTLVR